MTSQVAPAMSDNVPPNYPVVDVGQLDLLKEEVSPPSESCFRSIERHLTDLFSNSTFVSLVNAMGHLAKEGEEEKYSVWWFKKKLRQLEDLAKRLVKDRWLQAGAFLLLLVVFVGFCLFYANPVVLRLAWSGAGWLTRICQGSLLDLVGASLGMLSEVRLDFKTTNTELHIGPAGFADKAPLPPPCEKYQSCPCPFPERENIEQSYITSLKDDNMSRWSLDSGLDDGSSDCDDDENDGGFEMVTSENEFEIVNPEQGFENVDPEELPWM